LRLKCHGNHPDHRDDAALRESLAETLTDLGTAPRMASSGRRGAGQLFRTRGRRASRPAGCPADIDGIEALVGFARIVTPPPVVSVNGVCERGGIQSKPMRLGAFISQQADGRGEMKALFPY